VLELVLEVPETLKILVGQYMILVLQDFDGEFTRSYSVARYDGKNIVFLIKLKDIGRAGRALKKYREGDIVKIQGIHGNFVLQDTTNPKVFIATGTGLSPIYRMICQTQFGKELFFSVQKKEDVFYAKELQDTHITTHIFLTREEKIPEDTDHIMYRSGRMNLTEYEFSPETEFYICGAPSMVEDVKKHLGERGFKNIYFEKFTA